MRITDEEQKLTQKNKVEIRVVCSEERAWRISCMLEKPWPLPRSASQRRILMALYEVGSKRYLAYEGGELVAAMAVKKRWSRYHILQIGSVINGNGTSLVKSIMHLPLEVVATNFSKGFWVKMGFCKKEGPYHNVFVNNVSPLSNLRWRSKKMVKCYRKRISA